MDDELLSLRDVNKRLRDIIRLTSDLVWEADREHALISISENAIDHLGSHPSELIGRKIPELWTITSTQLPEWNKPFRDILSEYMLPDGSIRHFQLGGLPGFDDYNGSFVCIRGIAKDITAIITAEHDANVRQRQFGAIAEASGAAILILIPETGEVIYSNTAAGKMFCAQPGELLGSNGASLVADKNERKIVRREILNRSPVHNREIKIRRFDGEELWTLVSVEHIEYDDNETLLAVITDISRQKSTEKDLLDAKEEADKANRAKTDFLSSMSHELRTPMNSILGFGQLLARDHVNPLTDEQLEHLDYILKGGEHLLNLIDDVLDFANLETGVFVVEMSPVTVSTMVAECLPIISNLAEERGIDVRNLLEKDFDVLADPTRFRQVLLNLLSNAVKYNKPQGKIELSACISESGMCRISVSDTGPGIPSEKQDQLFLPFNRLGAGNTEIEGTGIGLSISSRLVELMKGHIGFENNTAEGATFWFELPIVEVAVAHSGADAEHNVTSVKGVAAENQLLAKLLYVEDNSANLKLMEQFVGRQENFELITAHTAELGLRLAQSERPDLIILDINLPGMDGFEMLDLLRAHSETHSIPVIALSADSMPSQVQRGMDAGFIDYLTKPIDLDRFEAALNRLIVD